MTEIQWLVDIMLHHKLPAGVRELFLARIGEVEKQLNTGVIINRGNQLSPRMGYQAPVETIPPEALAQTPAAAQALAAREQAIKAAGKTEVGRTSPRKF